jgi:SAUR family protein
MAASIKNQHKIIFTTKAFEIEKHSSYTHKSNNFRLMGFRLPGIIKRAANQTSSKGVDMPKGYLAVYVGEKMKRFVIPISYLNQPSFQELLNQAEEQFGYDHPTGGLTIPCREQVFLDITSHLNLC